MQKKLTYIYNPVSRTNHILDPIKGKAHCGVDLEQLVDSDSLGPGKNCRSCRTVYLRKNPEMAIIEDPADDNRSPSAKAAAKILSTWVNYKGAPITAKEVLERFAANAKESEMTDLN